jgi:S1-C subfamily serine protease
VREVTGQLQTGGEVRRAFLGITGATITREIARALKLSSNRGVLVQDAFEGGPASRAGIRGGSTQVTIGEVNLLLGGDIITGFAGKKVTAMEQIVDAVDSRKPGDEVKVAVLRDSEKHVVTVTLGQRPQQIQDSEQQLGNP